MGTFIAGLVILILVCLGAGTVLKWLLNAATGGGFSRWAKSVNTKYGMGGVVDPPDEKDENV